MSVVFPATKLSSSKSSWTLPFSFLFCYNSAQNKPQTPQQQNHCATLAAILIRGKAVGAFNERYGF